jgi:hypothetical protein
MYVTGFDYNKKKKWKYEGRLLLGQKDCETRDCIDHRLCKIGATRGKKVVTVGVVVVVDCGWWNRNIQQARERIETKGHREFFYHTINCYNNEYSSEIIIINSSIICILWRWLWLNGVMDEKVENWDGAVWNSGTMILQDAMIVGCNSWKLFRTSSGNRYRRIDKHVLSCYIYQWDMHIIHMKSCVSKLNFLFWLRMTSK